MAESNAIASGAAILTANADGLVTGLNKAEGEMKGWGKKVGGTLDKTKESFREKTADMFGISFKSVVGMAIAEVGKRFLNAATGLDAFQRQLGETERMIRNIAELMERTAATREKWLDVGAGPAATVANIDEAIKQLKRELADEKAGLAGASARASELEDPFGSGKGFLLWAGQRHGDTMADLMKPIEAARDRISTINKKLLELDERRTKLLDPDKDEAKIRMVNGMADALENQAAKWNLTAREAAIFEANQKNISPKQLNKYMDAWDRMNAAENMKSLAELEKGIERQILLFGQSASAAELYDLKLKGLSDDQLAYAESLMKSRDALLQSNQSVTTAGAMLAGSGEAYSLVIKNQLRALTGGPTDQKKALEEAKKTARAARDTARNTRDMAKDLARLKEI
jgi:hypothetical protein